MCGVGAELGQAMNELAFDHLDAPVARLHTDSMSHPFAPALERAMRISVESIVAASLQVIAGEAMPPRRARSGVAPAPVAEPTRTKTAPADSASLQPAAPPSARATAASSTPQLAPGEPLMMPFGDLTVSEGKLVRWVKKLGDSVRAGELVVEIETDKAVVEVEAPCSGRLMQLLAQEGEVVKMGQQIAVIEPTAA